MPHAVRFALLAVLLIAGCVRSLRPWYGPGDVVSDNAILGEWASDRESWSATRGKGQSYRLVHAGQDGKTGTFTAHLFKAGGVLFVDLEPVNAGLRESALFRGNLLAAHTIFIVERISPGLHLLALDPEWLADHLRTDPRSLADERIDEAIVITASTRDAQSFLLRHRETAGAFRPTDPWRRVSTAP